MGFPQVFLIIKMYWRMKIMSKKFILTNLVFPSPVFSQAIQVENFVYISGQVGDDLTGKLVNKTFKDEVVQAFENIKSILQTAGLNLKDVIKVTIFMSDMSLFNELNGIYMIYFPKNQPTRSAVEVSRLYLNARIEIEVIAYKD